MYAFRLYIIGGTPKAATTCEQIYRLMNSEFSDQYELEVVDLLQRPDRAEKDGVFATPTLVKVQPDPVRKVVGDLSDRKKILHGLGFNGAPPG